MRRTALLAAAMSLAATAVVSAQGAQSGGASITPFVPCGGSQKEPSAKCAELIVKEDRGRPESRVIRLRVTRLPAIDKRAGARPIFVFPGGPGQVASGMAARFVTSRMHRTHDIYFLNTRGTGPGNRLDCDTGASDGNPAAYIRPLFSRGRDFSACARALSKRADLNRYTVDEAARDYDDLRRLVGAKQVNIWAGSYGTRAALVYMRMFPERVAASALNGVTPIENRIPLFHARAAQAAFDKVVRACEGQKECGSKYRDLHGDLARVLGRLRTAPQVVKIASPIDSSPLDVPVTAETFGDGLRVMLYYDDTIVDVPRLVHAAAAGHLEPFAEAAVAGNRALYSIPLGMNLSFTCSEDVARIREDEIEHYTAGTFSGDARVRGQIAACSSWPSHPTSPIFGAAPETDIPVLVVSGRFDPVTPPSDGDLVAKAYPNSRHLVLPGAHGSDSECLDRLTEDFFASASTAKLDLTCVAGIKPLVFR